MKSVPLSDLNKTKPPEPILEHEIRIRAYCLYEQRGKRDGRALDDWLKAETEILGVVAAAAERWRPTTEHPEEGKAGVVTER
jgi:Protein of unknown function (DUF2934)